MNSNEHVCKVEVNKESSLSWSRSMVSFWIFGCFYSERGCKVPIFCSMHFLLSERKSFRMVLANHSLPEQYSKGRVLVPNKRSLLWRANVYVAALCPVSIGCLSLPKGRLSDMNEVEKIKNP